MTDDGSSFIPDDHGPTIPASKPVPASEDGTDTVAAPLSAGDAVSSVALPKPGDVIDHYTLREQIGEGGFGVVYKAEQTRPVKRTVALKIIKPGMDSKEVVARFQQERQAVAMMDHPGIAKVLGGGVTDRNLPYFVMEYVPGESVTTFCDRHKIGIKQRLGLFTEICDAIQHAHTKGILHRDIKPGNILASFDDQDHVRCKVIDFGVAKALNQQLTDQTVYTGMGVLIGTPEYMSPEQAEMSPSGIDTRSDVYSLGVLLYELLTGSRPFDLKEAALAEAQRIIREQDPPKPTTRLSTLGEKAAEIAKARKIDAKALRSQLRGELEWIILRALKKDRQERYDSASGLGRDVQRHLEGEPVEAGPDSGLYRLNKAVRKHKGAFAAAALVFVVLLAGIAGTTWGLIRASAALERAETAEREASDRADELQLVADFQSEQLGAIDVPEMGTNLRQALLDGAPEDQRDALDAALAGINFTNIALGTLEGNIFERTIEAIDSQFKDQPLVQAQLLQSIAAVLRDLGLLARATDPQERALAIRREQLGNEHPATLSSMNNMGILLEAQGKLSEAEPYYREALEGQRRVLGDEHPDTLVSINNMGLLLQAQGKLSEAEPYCREALEGSRRVLGDEHPNSLASINNMGTLCYAQGKLAEAEPYWREAVEGYRRVLGDEHPNTLKSIGNMGSLLWKQGKLSEAEPYFREALEGFRRVLGDEHSHTLVSINSMGSLLKAQGKLSEAEPYHREALEGRRRVLGDEHPRTLISIYNTTSLQIKLNRFPEAESLALECERLNRKIFGDPHPETTDAIYLLIKLYTAWHEAEPDGGYDAKAEQWRAKLPEQGGEPAGAGSP